MAGAVIDQARVGRIEKLPFDPAEREREPVRECNLCAGTRLVEVSRIDRYGYHQPFVVCSACGLGFLSPRLAAEEYAAFYRDTYRPLVSAYHGRLIDADTVQVEQREYAAELAQFLERALPRGPRTIMDIGGSTGVVAGEIRGVLGAEATVLDPATDELAVAAEAGMETIEGFAEDYDPGGRTWDLVLLCQTIDHLLDVTATLEAIRRMLGPDSRAFVDVLDVRFMARRRGSIEGAVKVDHPYYLTRDTAEGFFVKSGLRPVAERMSDDGHWGFLLEPAEPAEPDLPALRAAADHFLAEVWARRAG
jgi:SAM-dependent methyltransferase